jgi:hypothetical protein
MLYNLPEHFSTYPNIWTEGEKQKAKQIERATTVPWQIITFQHALKKQIILWKHRHHINVVESPKDNGIFEPPRKPSREK